MNLRWLATLWLALCCVFASAIGAAAEYRVDFAWWVDDHEVFLKSFDESLEGGFQRALRLPPEIDPQQPWAGIVLTDGNALWNVIVLTPKAGNADLPTLERKLRAHSGFLTMVRERKFKLVSLGEKFVAIVPTHLPQEFLESDFEPLVFDALDELREKFSVGAVTYSHEWDFYPDELPPETKKDGAYLRRVRESRESLKSPEDIVANKGHECTLFGLNWDESVCRAFAEFRAKAGSVLAEHYENSQENRKAFRFAPRWGKVQQLVMTYRHEVVDPKIVGRYVTFNAGFRHRLEDEGGENPYNFHFTASMHSAKPDLNAPDSQRKQVGNWFIGVPDQLENVTQQDEVLSCEELNALNLAIRDDLCGVIQSILDLCSQWKTGDIVDMAAYSTEERFVFLCAFPENTIVQDLATGEKLKDSIWEMLEKTTVPHLNDGGMEDFLAAKSMIDSFALVPTGEKQGEIEFYQLQILKPEEAELDTNGESGVSAINVPMALAVGPGFFGLIVNTTFFQLFSEENSDFPFERFKILYGADTSLPDQLRQILEETEQAEGTSDHVPMFSLESYFEKDVNIRCEANFQGRSQHATLEFPREYLPNAMAVFQISGGILFLQKAIFR